MPTVMHEVNVTHNSLITLTVHKTTLHLLGILELLHEASVFPDTGDVEGLNLSPDGEDEVVIRDRRRGHRALDLRRICKAREYKSPLSQIATPKVQFSVFMKIAAPIY